MNGWDNPKSEPQQWSRLKEIVAKLQDKQDRIDLLVLIENILDARENELNFARQEIEKMKENLDQLYEYLSRCADYAGQNNRYLAHLADANGRKIMMSDPPF